MSERLEFRIRDVVTDVVLLEQGVTRGDAVAQARVSRDRAVTHACETGHPVMLEVHDPDGDLHPAGEWTEITTVCAQR